MDVKTSQQLRLLKAAAEKEQDTNARVSDSMFGVPVVYGQIVQLRHVSSRAFLHVCDKVLSESERNASVLRLYPNGSESAYFKILPRFKIHSEGERVSVDDKVILMSVKGSLRVHPSPNPLPLPGSQPKFEVTASQTDVHFAWRLMRYDAYDIKRRHSLSSGAVIRLKHTEKEAHLTISDDLPPVLTAEDLIKVPPQERDLYLRKYRGSSPGERNSALSLWEIQLKDSFEGGAVLWEKAAGISSSPFSVSIPIRLRNVATGMFLMWKSDDIAREPARSFRKKRKKRVHRRP